MRYPIVRLQVQTDPIKVGRAPLRTYDPQVLESLPRIEIGPDGVIGIARFGQALLDVHNVRHPLTRDPRGRAGLSVMGTGDYVRLRARYGDHLTEGMAGETMLVDAPDGLAGAELPDQLVLHTESGPIRITGVQVSAPCVEFVRFCLHLPASPEVGPAVQQGLIDLDGGARGYYGVAATAGVVAVGDHLEWA